MRLRVGFLALSPRAAARPAHAPSLRRTAGWCLLRHLRSPPTRGARAAAVGEALGYFHGCGGRHADLHAGNILVREEEEQTQAWIIDLDKAEFDGSRGARRPAELKRLAHSLEKRNRLASVDREIRSCFRNAYETGLEAGLDQTSR